MLTCATKKEEFSPQKRAEESPSSWLLSLYTVSQCCPDMDYSKYLSFSIKHLRLLCLCLGSQCQVLCVVQRKIKFLLFGAESLIEQTEVQPITVESDKSLQEAVGPQGSRLMSGLLSQTSLNFTTEIMLFIDSAKYP